MYDNIGNPTTYYNGGTDADKYTFSWQNGRELASTVNGGVTTSYKYGADGLRVQKTVGSVVYNYYYSDGLLVRQTWGSNYIDFLYDESGLPYSFVYGTVTNGTVSAQQYYYVKNLQGDVMAIANASGNIVVEYNYDAWGYVLNITGSLADTIGNINPIRYRSYYYDTDTDFYYLQTRYYDPAIRRFINADVDLNANGDFIGFNMYAYCGNNPVMGYDPTGEWNWGGVIIGLGIIAATVVTVATFGIGSMAGAVIATAAISTGAMVTYAAATDATLVVYLSFSKSDGSNYAKAGCSLVIDFDSDSSSAYLYPHLGVGKGYSDGLSYSVGLVENFEDPKDYAGAFFDASITGFMGVDHCCNPWTNYEQSTKANSLTFSNGFSASVGYDWYFEPIKVWGK